MTFYLVFLKAPSFFPIARNVLNVKAQVPVFFTTLLLDWPYHQYHITDIKSDPRGSYSNWWVSEKRNAVTWGELACENIRFSSLFAAGDVSRGGTSATQWQKFHTDDANQCLLNKSGSHGALNANLLNFTFLLVDFGKVKRLYSTNINCFVWDSSRLHLTFVGFCLSFVNNS